MGKTKKQKRKEQDFRKPKLKVGKKRPEADNVTKTVFKAASIQLSSQLQEKQEPTNRRKLSLQDLLGQLNHYNGNIRQSALEGLKELLIDHPQVIASNLGKIVTKIAEKLMDLDSRVRSSLLSCFSHILRNVTEVELLPFVEVIVAHLKCAMTHINEDIQVDAMAVLDQCLKQFPRLFAKYNKRFLTTIVGLITKGYKSEDKKAVVHKGIQNTSMLSKGSSKLSTLSFDSQPRTKSSGTQVKSSMLSRIKNLLDNEIVNVTEADTQNDIASYHNPDEVCLSLLQSQKLTGEFMFEPISSFSMEKNLKETSENTSMKNADILCIIPLLFDTWVECSPYQFSSGFLDKHLDKGQLELMTTISNILKHLITRHWTNDSISKSDVLTKFGDHFVKYFPFLAPKLDSVNIKKKMKVNTEEITYSLFQVNLDVAEIICFIAENTDDVGVIEHWIHDLESYLKMSFESTTLALLNTNNSTLLQVASLLIKSQEETISAPVLQSMELLYTRSNLNSSQRVNIVEFLKSLVWNARAAKLLTNSRMNSWLKFLAMDLPKAVFRDQLQLYSELTTFFLTMLKQDRISKSGKLDITRALSDIFGLQVTKFEKISQELQMKTIELIYFLDELPSALVKNVAVVCQRGCVALTIRKSIVYMLLYRSPAFKGKVQDEKDLGLFLSFMVSVIIGHTQEHLEEIQKREIWSSRIFKPGILVEDEIKSSASEQVEHEAEAGVVAHKSLIETCLDGLRLQPISEHLCALFDNITKMMLMKYFVLPEKTALGLLLLAECVIGLADATNMHDHDNLAQTFAPLIASSLFSYESNEMRVLNEDISIISESEFSSEISRAAISLLKVNGIFLEALVHHWRSLIQESAHQIVPVAVAESMLFVLKTCTDVRMPSSLQSLILDLVNSEELKNKSELIAQLQYHSSLRV